MEEGRRESKWADLLLPALLLSLTLIAVFKGDRGTCWWWGWVTLASVFIATLIGTLLNLLIFQHISRAAAGQIADSEEVLEREKHTYRPARDADWRGLSKPFYDETTREMQAAGFRPLGDYVLEELANAGCISGRAVLRVFLDHNGYVQAAVAEIKIIGFAAVLQWLGVIPRKMRLVEFETELSDGRFIITHRVPIEDISGHPPEIAHHRVADDMTIAEMKRLHDSRVADALKASEGVTPLWFASVAEVLASQARQQRMKAKYRKANRLSPEDTVRQYSERDELNETDEEIADALRHERERRDREREGRQQEGGDPPSDNR